MKAMILAAGLGSRLRPLTDSLPKALVEVNGMPLLEMAIRRLMHFGCREIVVNVHHFARQIIEFLEQKNQFGIKIAISDERDRLLNTGGGLKKASRFFRDGRPFLMCNTDILCDINLNNFYQDHLQRGGLATLAVRRRETSRYLIFDDQYLLHGWTNIKTGEVLVNRQGSERLQMWAFSGLQVIDPQLFDWMPEEDVFSIIRVYLSACAENEVRGYVHDDDQWMDVGKPEALSVAGPLAKKLIDEWSDPDFVP